MRLTKAEILLAGLWFAVWLVAVGWAAVTVPQVQLEGGAISTGAMAFAVVLLALVVLCVVACAVWLANCGRWWVVALLGIYVSCLFFAWYLAAMLLVPIPAGQPDTQDDAAAVGLIFLAVPTVMVVGILVTFGAALGAALRRLRPRRLLPTRPS